MQELSRQHPRYGYRRITALLRREGRRVNRKRVHRLWKREGLRVVRRQRKRRRLGTSAGSCVRRRAERVNQVWSYDFVWDQTADGRMLKILPVVDEVSRECLAILVGRSITAEDVVALLERLIEEHGAPEFIRSDNGPEFIAEAIREFVKARGLETVFIAPGSPWENAYSETFNSRFRDELLDRELFTSLTEGRVVIEEYRRDYNQHRPHSSLGYLTPSEFRRLQERRSEETEESEAQNRGRTNATDRGIGRRTPEMAVIEPS
jgi:transposase InsO family protein